MSNEQLIIEERASDIGDFLVGRLLPFRKKRMVGPFIFIDHMGPKEIGDGNFLEIDQHPHIGLSTLTYLFEGEIQHEDGLGTKQLIKPGSVNFMTAGSGVSHTERTPEYLRLKEKHTIHGFQIWIALPKTHEDMQPTFQHVAANDLPKWKEQNLEYMLIAGEAWNRKSPLDVFSPLFMIELKANETTDFNAKGLVGEIGVCVVKGSVNACGNKIEAGNMLVSKTDDVCNLRIEKGSHLLLFGGEAFEEKRNIYWNFVHSEKSKIEQAKKDWANKSFPMMPWDNTYIPLPGI